MQADARHLEHASGLVVVHVGANGRAMDTQMTITAKWISSSCGDGKPGTAKE